jgi:transposase
VTYFHKLKLSADLIYFCDDIMPRHLTDAEKARVVAKLEEHWTLAEVAADLNVSKSCIFYVKKRWQEMRLQRPARQGVGRISNENEDNALVEYLQQNPFDTAVKAREETHFPGSLRTAQRRMKQSVLKSYVAARKVFLREEHKQRRMQFANEFLNQGNEFWNRVVFSDEKTFQSCNNGRLRVYRPRNSRFEEEYTLRSSNSGRFSVNVWAWISVQGPGVCWKIDERFTAVNYRSILENVMLPSVTQVFPGNFVFQHVRMFNWIAKIYNNHKVFFCRITVPSIPHT